MEFTARLLRQSGGTRSQVTAMVQDLIRHYADHEGVSPYDINNGSCYRFADELAKKLTQRGIKAQSIASEELQKEEDGIPTEWDVPLLKKYWLKTPPAGLTWEDIETPEFLEITGSHCMTFVPDLNLWFDSEAPEGVPIFFDLPMYKKCIHEYKRETERHKEGAFAPGTKAVQQIGEALANITSIEKTGGNCGAFAIALANELGRKECEFALSSSEWDLDQPSFGHIGVLYQGQLFDGNGATSEDQLNRWSEDEDEEAAIHYIPAVEPVDQLILKGTDPSLDPQSIQKVIRKALSV